jgi:hypothetical protein
MAAVLAWPGPPAQAQAHKQAGRDGQALFADVAAYAAQGDHLTGYPGADRAARWLEKRLGRLGYAVHRQTFDLRQYRGARAALAADGKPIAAALQWWPPDAAAPVTRVGRIRRGPGSFVILPVKVGDQSYLGPAVEAQIRAAIADGAAAVLLQTETALGADGPFLFNVRPQSEPWPVPVLAIGARDGARLQASGAEVRLTFAGRLETIAAANIVARLDRPGTDTAVVISTPYTGWGPCGGERGPGIAMFLALAEWARSKVPHDVILVATAGHEVGHSGMERFLASTDAPGPEATALWLHLGASIAIFGRAGSSDANAATRYALHSASLAEPVRAHLASAFVPIDTAVAAFGEVGDVVRAGYPDHLGFAGYGPHHHLPSDTAAATSPALLGDAWSRLLATLEMTRALERGTKGG